MIRGSFLPLPKAVIICILPTNWSVLVSGGSPTSDSLSGCCETFADRNQGALYRCTCAIYVPGLATWVGLSSPCILHCSKLCVQPWSITWGWTWEQLPMSTLLRKSSKCTMRSAWPSPRWIVAEPLTLPTCNFCRSITSLHVTTKSFSLMTH